MLVAPGTNSSSVLDQVTMIRKNGKRNVSITLLDDAGNPIDIDESIDSSGNPRGLLELEVVSATEISEYSESYWPPPSPDNRRIEKASTGRYQIVWGDDDGETSNTGPLVFCWHIRQGADTEDLYRTQVVDVVSARSLSLLPKFRLLIDKSLKVVVPEEYCNLGYSDAQLMIYLQAGLARINEAQPYPMWMDIDQFPIERGWELLTRSALAYSLLSQTMFAIDTDIPAYSDNSHSFVLAHAPHLKGLYDKISMELEKDIREFKLHYINSGSLGLELRIGYGFYAMIASSPAGALFRRAYTNL